MKVALIQPNTPGTEGWCPPLGLAYLAAALEQEGHHVQILDLNATNVQDEELLRLADLASPDVIGITSTMASHRESLRVASLLRQYPIIFGGPQASARPEPYLEIEHSIVFNGEAERSLPLYLHEIAQSRSGRDTPGIIYRDNTGKIVRTPPLPLITRLDEFPLPSRHLFDMNAYSVRLHGRRATNMMSSRGCPFDCVFCYHDYLGKVYRVRSPKSIVDEMELLQRDYGVGAILFYDDNFTLNRRHVRALCNQIKDRKLDMYWRCYSRVNAVDRALLELMREAGCREIVFGVESGSQRTLDIARKGIRVEDSLTAIRLCRDLGISTKSYLMIGFPWETKEDIQTTVDFIDEILPSQVHLVIVVPFPGTPLERQLLEQGIEIDEDVDITGIAQPSFATQNFTKADLLAFRDLGYAKTKQANVDHVLSYEWRQNPDWRRQFERGNND